MSENGSGACLTWDYSIIIASVVRGLVKWRVRYSGPTLLALLVEPGSTGRHPAEATTLLAVPPTHVPWIQPSLAELRALRSSGGYALLTGEPPGSAALILLEPMQPHLIQDLWLYVSPGPRTLGP